MGLDWLGIGRMVFQTCPPDSEERRSAWQMKRRGELSDVRPNRNVASVAQALPVGVASRVRGSIFVPLGVLAGFDLLGSP
jgi:hypothetical protein